MKPTTEAELLTEIEQLKKRIGELEARNRRASEQQVRDNETRLQSLVRILQHESPSVQAFLDYALDEAIQLTESKIGYIYLYNEKKREFTLNTWSRGVMDVCAITEPKTVYHLDNTGVWGEAVRQRKEILVNDFHAPHPLKKGYPEGHAPLNKFLTVPVFNSGKIVAVVGVANKETDYDQSDVLQLKLLMDGIWKETDRITRETALQQANEQLRKNYRKTRTILEDLKVEVQARVAKEAELQKVTMAVEQAGEVVVITDSDGMIQYVNPAFETVTGYSRTEVLGRNLRILKSGDHDEAFYHDLWDSITRGQTWQGRMNNKSKDGRRYTEEATISPVFDAAGSIINYVAVKRDITEQLKLTAQFQQAQKMESVGRLAGGVAHDYNNMLSVIMGASQLAMTKMDPSDKWYADFEQIEQAAQRSAEITRKLLGFARKQTISPKVLDLNTAIEGMLKMLRRLLREDLTLSWQPGTGVWQALIDPSQVDQILVNLCVNARDAIEGTGEILIETRNVVFDPDYCEFHKGFIPGEYIMVAISDNGCGMDKNTLDLIFEPFFTTKKVGRGTGLGLAMVYGIVKQNNGFINVYSEPGRGTTFKMYFPRVKTGIDGKTGPEEQKPETGRGETILLVEDEPALLTLATQLLEGLNYTVLSASRPDEALHLAEKNAGKIHLLLTDVVMPEMNGRELADRISSRYADMKLVFMSGYTSDVIVHQGVLDKGMHFIQKPLSIHALAAKVRQVLDKNGK